MAIYVEIKDSKIADNKLSLTIDTTNDDKPNIVRRFEGEFATTMTAAEIKTAIDEAVTLLWLATSVSSWTV